MKKFAEIIDVIEQHIFRLTIEMDEAYGANPKPWQDEIELAREAIALLSSQEEGE